MGAAEPSTWLGGRTAGGDGGNTGLALGRLVAFGITVCDASPAVPAHHVCRVTNPRFREHHLEPT